MSAAGWAILPDDSFEHACDFPALAWLPHALRKDDVLIRRLAVPER